jgi:hypothetical protein
MAGLLAVLAVTAGSTGVACNAVQGWSVNSGLPSAPIQR